MIGSPMVFHTAPPQPASKARMIWYAVLVGGPEASQKGLGERTPQKLMLRSGIDPPAVGSFQCVMNSRSGFLAMGDGIHHFTATIDTVPASEIARIAGLHGIRIHGHTAVCQLQARNLLEEVELALLSQSFDHHFHTQAKLASGDRGKAAASARGFGTRLRAHTFERGNMACAVIDYAHRLCLPDKVH